MSDERLTDAELDEMEDALCCGEGCTGCHLERRSIAELRHLRERERDLERRLNAEIVVLIELGNRCSRLTEVVQRVVHFGTALIEREYEPGSVSVVELVEQARAVLAAEEAAEGKR